VAVAEELVSWLHTADTAYRNEFRELFEANFDRIGFALLSRFLTK